MRAAKVLKRIREDAIAVHVFRDGVLYMTRDKVLIQQILDGTVWAAKGPTRIVGKNNGFWVVTRSTDVTFRLTSDPHVLELWYGDAERALIRFPKPVLSLPTDAWDTTKAGSH